MAVKKPLTVKPSELTTSGRLPSDQRLLCRVAQAQAVEDRFTCYLVCGSNPKELLSLEAWSSLATVAREKLQNQQVVSLTNVMISQTKSTKKKFSHSMSSFYIRFDRETTVENESNNDKLPQDVPAVTFAFAHCMKQGLVDVKALVVDVRFKQPDGKRKDPLTVVLLKQPGKRASTEVELTAWREHAQAGDQLVKNTVYTFKNLAVARDKQNTFSLNWLPKTEHIQDADNTAVQFRADLALGQGTSVNYSIFRGNKSKSYETIAPKITSLSMLFGILQPGNAKDMPAEDVWEVPCVSITSVTPTAKSDEELREMEFNFITGLKFFISNTSSFQRLKSSHL